MNIVKKIFGIDLRTLALIRVCFGLLIIYDLILRSTSFIAFHTDQGLLPRSKALWMMNPWQFSIHLYSGQAVYQAALFIIAAIFAVMLTFGYKTRLATIVSWFLYVSLQNRNTQITQLSDNLLSNLLLFSIFLPLGAKFSVDGALNKKQVEDNQFFSIASLALLFQAMYVYFFGAMMKLAPEWHNGLAVYQIMHFESYSTPIASWFREIPHLPFIITYFVYFIELLGPFFMFSPVLHVPLRVTVMALYIIMHAGFIVFLGGIGIFPFVSFTSILAFTPGSFWDWIYKKIKTKEREGIVIYYDKDCPFCYKVCLIFRSFLLLPTTPIHPAQDYKNIYKIMQEKNSWVVKDYDGEKYVRWDAVILVLQRSFLFWPLAYIFKPDGMKKINDWLYESVAKNRAKLGSYAKTLLPLYSTNVHSTWKVTNILVSFLFLVDLWFNIGSINYKMQLPTPIQPMISFMNLSSWGMFTGFPPEAARWHIIEGTTREGKTVDVYNNKEQAPSYDVPDAIIYTYKDYRWRKYMQHLQWSGNNKDDFGRYFCSKWNKGRPYEKQIRQIKVVIGDKFYQAEEDKKHNFDKNFNKFIYYKNILLMYNCDTNLILKP